MPVLLARLSRIVPLLAALAILALVVYLVVSYRRSPNRAKEVLIRLFTVLTGVLLVFFGLVCAYALLEHNEAVFDLALTCVITAIVGLVVTQICRAVFLRNHPTYRLKPSKTSKPGKKSKDANEDAASDKRRKRP